MSEQPRLLFCAFDVIPGPYALSRRLTEYLKGLSSYFQVVVLSNKAPDQRHIETYLGARLLRVPVGNGELPSQIQSFERAVRRQLESEEYLVVHFFDPFSGYPLCEQKADMAYKVVYDASSFPSVDLGMRDHGSAGSRRFLAKARRQELFCLMNADAVITGTEVTRSWLVSLGVPEEQVHVIRPPTDIARYVPEALGAPDAVPMKLVHLGGPKPYHEMRNLLSAMRAVLQTCDVRLAIVGPRSPEEQSTLEEDVERLSLTGKVELHPAVPHDDLPKVLASADVGVATSEDSERCRVIGSPRSKLAEYLAAGRPVLVADLPTARELVPTEAATFYQPGDVDSLARAILNLAKSPDLRASMGRHARAAASAFDAHRVRGELLGLYGQLTARALVPAAPELERAPEDSASPTQQGFAPSAAEPREFTDGSVTPASSGPPLPARDSDPDGEREPTDPAFARPERLDAESASASASESVAVPPAEAPLIAAAPPTSTPPFAEVVGGNPSAPAEVPAPTIRVSPLPFPGSAPPDVPAVDPPAPAPSPNHPSPLAEAAVLTLRMAPATTPPSAGPPPLPSALDATLRMAPATTPPSAGPPPLPSALDATLRMAPVSTPPTAMRAAVALPSLRLGALSPLSPLERSTPSTTFDEAEEIDEQEVLELGDEPSEDPELRVMEADELQAQSVEARLSPPTSALDPWLAQMVHGYCPPESNLFERHTPPTTTPGRDT